MWANCSCTASNVAANSASTCAVSSLISDSSSSRELLEVAALLAQEGGALRRARRTRPRRAG